MDVKNNVGKVIADFSSWGYNGFQDGYGIKWQCVWFARGRAMEKLKADTGIRGNANEWYDKAKAKKLPTGGEVRSNSIACYNRGKHGHVAFIEEVANGEVFYTEANATGDDKQSPDDGMVKKMSVSAFKSGNGYQGCIYLAEGSNEDTNNNQEGYNVAKTYKNGSTIETVYAETNFKTKIGTLDKYEQCDCLEKVGGAYLVRYKVNGTNTYKCGFVKYNGGIK